MCGRAAPPRRTISPSNPNQRIHPPVPPSTSAQPLPLPPPPQRAHRRQWDRRPPLPHPSSFPRVSAVRPPAAAAADLGLESRPREGQLQRQSARAPPGPRGPRAVQGRGSPPGEAVARALGPRQRVPEVWHRAGAPTEWVSDVRVLEGENAGSSKNTLGLERAGGSGTARPPARTGLHSVPFQQTERRLGLLCSS